MSEILALLVLLGVVAALIACNGFFVAAEFSLVSSARPRLEQLAAEGRHGARLLVEVLSDAASQDQYIATSQLGLSLASLGLGMYAEHSLVTLLLPHLERLVPVAWAQQALCHGVATVTVLAFLTFFHVLLGEMVPKSLAVAHPEGMAMALVLPMRMLGMVLLPIVWVSSLTGHAVLRTLRLPVSKDVSFVYSPEELRRIFEESHERGLLEGEEHDLMQKVMTFGERAVRQVMVARTRAVGIPVEATVDQALAQVAREAYTRYPVYERDLDHIVGMVHVKDLVGSRVKFPGDRPVKEIVRSIPMVPESMDSDEVFEKLQAGHVQMAVVLDEHGGTAGIVTMEDLLEEVFGELRDEFDAEEEEPIQALPDGALRVRGDVLIQAVGEQFDRPLEFEEVETINGLVMDLLGRPPRVGDQVEAEGIRVSVESVHDRAVAMARVVNLAPTEVAAEGGESS